MRSRFALLWLALHRRRRMLAALALGMVVFETLIVVIANTIPPTQLFGGQGRTPPGAFKAFSGSTGDVSIASYPGLLGAGLVHPFWIAMQLTVIGSLAAAAVAADVESGTIELLMVRPVSRARLLAERTAALAIASVLLNAAATGTVAAGVLLTAPAPRGADHWRLRGGAARLRLCPLPDRFCACRLGSGPKEGAGGRGDDSRRIRWIRRELRRAGLVQGSAIAFRQPVPLLHTG